MPSWKALTKPTEDEIKRNVRAFDFHFLAAMEGTLRYKVEIGLER